MCFSLMGACPPFGRFISQLRQVVLSSYPKVPKQSLLKHFFFVVLFLPTCSFHNLLSIGLLKTLAFSIYTFFPARYLVTGSYG